MMGGGISLELGAWNLHSEEFLYSRMRKQLKLSITCALSFLLVDVRMKTRVLHAPEKLGLKQEYVEEHQAGH